MKIKFSQPAVEIIEHRLGVPDALAGCLEEDGHPAAAVFSAVGHLSKLIKGVFDFDTLSPVERDVLIDCANGSTALADIEDAVATHYVSRGWARRLSTPATKNLI